tara:strand:- start:13589 stop:14137 length:549 start_codon:yes stop_codon:yes gene_type:complete
MAASLPPQTVGPGSVDPLAQLRDIHLPGPIDSWPPAPGWWILAIAAMAVVIYGLYYLYQRWMRNQYRRDALKHLGVLKTTCENEPAEYLTRFNELLKRVALSHYTREQVASLTGEAWVAFLDLTGETQEFSMGAGQVLVSGNYRPDRDISIDDLHQIGSHWIKHHRALTHDVWQSQDMEFST